MLSGCLSKTSLVLPLRPASSILAPASSSLLFHRGTKSKRGGRHAWPKPLQWPHEYEDPVRHKRDIQDIKETGEYDRKKVGLVGMKR